MQDKKHLTKMLDQYLETTNEEPGEDVVRAGLKYREAQESFLKELFDSAWKEGFAYAMKTQTEKK